MCCKKTVPIQENINETLIAIKRTEVTRQEELYNGQNNPNKPKKNMKIFKMMKTVMNMSKLFKYFQNIHILNTSDLKIMKRKNAQSKTAVKLPHMRKLSKNSLRSGILLSNDWWVVSFVGS